MKHFDTLKKEQQIFGTMASSDIEELKTHCSEFNKDHFLYPTYANSCRLLLQGFSITDDFQKFEDLGISPQVAMQCLEMNNLASWLKTGFSHLEDSFYRRKAVEEAAELQKKAMDHTKSFANTGKSERLLDAMNAYSSMRMAVGDGSPFGYDVLDYVLSGFRPGEVLGVVGLSGHGKTNFAINIFDNFLRSNNQPPASYFSFEMNNTDLFPKVLQMITGLSRKEIKHMVDTDLNRVTQIISGSHWRNVKFYYDPIDIPEMQLEISKNKSPIAIVDHVGLTHGDSDEYKRPDLIKKMANQTGCRVIPLFQVDKAAGREHFKRDGTLFVKRPRIIDAMGGSRVRASLNHGICVFKEESRLLAYFDKTRELEDYKAIEVTKYDMLMDMDWKKNQMRDLILLDEEYDA